MAGRGADGRGQSGLANRTEPELRQEILKLRRRIPKLAAMPPNQRVGFHDREYGPPLDHAGKHHKRDPYGVIGTARFGPTLLVKRQLLPQEEILRGQVCPRSEDKR